MPQVEKTDTAMLSENWIPVTQFLRPFGTPRPMKAPCDDKEALRKAGHILRKGYTFTCEVLTTGEVAQYITDPKAEEDKAIRVTPNGPEVQDALVDMINDFFVNLECYNTKDGTLDKLIQDAAATDPDFPGWDSDDWGGIFGLVYSGKENYTEKEALALYKDAVRICGGSDNAA